MRDIQPLMVDRVIDIPLPTYRLASSAMQALQVDAELSPLVHRTFTLASSHDNSLPHVQSNGDAAGEDAADRNRTILRTQYKATTNRMLRVAVNGFMESLGVVLGVMEVLDIDVLEGDNPR